MCWRRGKDRHPCVSCAAVSKGFAGRELTDMEGLLAAGAAGFTDDGIPLMEGTFVREAMEEAARLDTVLSFHEEDKHFIRGKMVQGVTSAHTFAPAGQAHHLHRVP